MTRRTTSWTRRRFLRALGLGAGAALVGPTLGDIFAHADGGSGAPCRFVFLVEGNGVEPVTMLSTRMRAAIDTQAASPVEDRRVFYRDYGHSAPLVVHDALLSDARSLGALAGGPDTLGLDDRAAVVLGLSSKITGGGHSSNFGALSCTRSNGTSPSRATIDHALGQLAAVRRETPFDVLRLGLGSRLMYNTCAFGRGKPAPIIGDPEVGFNSVFGAVASASGQRAFRRRSELLDYAFNDVNRALAALPGNSRERAKLERYLESIEQLTERQQRLVDMEATLTAVKPDGPDASALYAGAPLERLEAQVDVATAALLGGLTNVVVLGSGTGSAFSSLIYSSVPHTVQELPNRHDVCHQSAAVPEFRELLHDVTQRHVGLLAKMARVLAATPEVGAEGSMLDHTVLVYMSDNGEQHHSTGEEWPMLLIGGQALGLKTDGRGVVFPKFGHANNRQVSNLFNTVGYAAGQPWDTFGGETLTRIATGPLSELWGV